MAGTRTVYRGSHGRFAGASAGKAEKVKAGGFANAAFQARFQATRASRANAAPPKPAGAKAPPARTTRSRSSFLGKRGFTGKKGNVKGAVLAGTLAAATTTAGFGATRALGGSRLTSALVGAAVGLNTGQAIRGVSAGRAVTRPKNPTGKRIKR